VTNCRTETIGDDLLTKDHRQPRSPGLSGPRRLAQLSCLVAALGLLLGWPAIAAGATGIAVAVSGTVLSLQGDQWAELPARAQVLDGIPVRTLQGAEAELVRGEITLKLGPNTALQVDQAAYNLTLVTQYAGTVSVDARIPANQRLMLRTPKMTVALGTGHNRLVVAGDTGEVSVDLGQATVVDLTTGQQQTVPAGVTLSEVTADAALPGTSGNNGNAGGNGNGNAGGNGNGNAGGNGNGNAGGNGNGNAGGNGNGNGGGNGNGNGGGNGNGNGGGNGNGNGGGNGNPPSP